jgi:hypothetical protein
MKMTQREYILEQLLAGRKITRLDIFMKYGVLNCQLGFVSFAKKDTISKLK